jgi:hypothetical protein
MQEFQSNEELYDGANLCVYEISYDVTNACPVNF